MIDLPLFCGWVYYGSSSCKKGFEKRMSGSGHILIKITCLQMVLSSLKEQLSRRNFPDFLGNSS